MPRAECTPGLDGGQRGITLLEVMLVVILMGMLAGMGVPRFLVAAEQTRVDQAASALHSLWLAERLHWLEHRSFTADLDELADQRFLDHALVAQDQPFVFELDAADEQAFEASAVRTGSEVWTGTVSIDESGTCSGSTQDGGGHVVSPVP